MGLPFPVAVLSLEDAAELVVQQLVVPLCPDDQDRSAGGTPRGLALTSRRPPGLGLVAFVRLTEKDPLGGGVDSARGIRAPTARWRPIAQMRGNPATTSGSSGCHSGLGVYLDAADLPLIGDRAHDPTRSCAASR
jgi:hypothetical protein